MKLAHVDRPADQSRGDGTSGAAMTLVRDPAPASAAAELEEARHLCQTLAAERNQLRERLHRARARVETLERQAVEASRSNEQVLGCLAQELRTPLQSMALNVEMALRRHGQAMDQVPPDWTVERLRHMRSAVHRLHRLCDTFVSTTALESGELMPHLESVDLRQMLLHVADRMADEVAWAGCALTVTADEPLVGQWDRQHLDHIVAGLLDSAMRHGAGRPITVSLCRVHATDGGADQALLELRLVAGNLPGPDLEVILRPAGQPGHALPPSSSGLGLWLVRTLAAGMGGVAGASTAEPDATVLTVRLPLPPR